MKKKFHQINEPNLEGFTKCYKNGHSVTCINVEYLWKVTKCTDKFIPRFSRVILHEHIHSLINSILLNKRRTHYGEEKVVRKLTREPFRKKDKKDYIRKGGIVYGKENKLREIN